VSIGGMFTVSVSAAVDMASEGVTLNVRCSGNARDPACNPSLGCDPSGPCAIVAAGSNISAGGRLNCL
jgi:hypothetical protein